MASSIVKHSEYDIGELTFNPLANPKKKTLQSILLPSYNGGRGPLIQLPSIDLDMYGIPSKCDFSKEDTPKTISKIAPTPKEPRNTQTYERVFLRNLMTN